MNEERDIAVDAKQDLAPAQSSASPSPGWRRALRALVVVTLLASAFKCAYALVDGFRLLFLPYETTYPESLVLYGAQRVAAGGRLYPDIGSIPYVIDVYNPLAYLPAGIAGATFRLDLESIRLIGRVISFSSLLCLFAVVAYWVWRKTGRKSLAFFSAGLLLYFQFPVLTDFFRIRPDIPALLFAVAGMAVFDLSQRKSVVVPAVLLFIAFLFKQWFIAGAATILLSLVLWQDWRALLRFCGTYGAMLVVFLLIMFATTHRSYYMHAIVAMASNEVHPISNFAMMMRIMFADIWGLLASILVAVCMLAWRREFRLLLLYLCVCCAWTFYSGGKDGASLNYYAEFLVISVVLICLSVALVGRRQLMIRLLVLLPLIVQAIATFFVHGFSGPRMTFEKQDISAFVDAYKGTQEKVLILEEGPAIHTEKVEALDWYLLDKLTKKGFLTVAPLKDRIMSGYYDAIVVPPPRRMTSAMQGILEETARGHGYKLQRKVESFTELRRAARHRVSQTTTETLSH